MNKQTLLKLWIWNYKRYVQKLSNLAKRVNSTFLLEKLRDIEAVRDNNVPPFGAERDVVYMHHVSVIRNMVIPELERLCDTFEIDRTGMNDSFLDMMDKFDKLEQLNQAVADYTQHSFDLLEGLGGHMTTDMMENRLYVVFNDIIPQK